MLQPRDTIRGPGHNPSTYWEAMWRHVEASLAGAPAAPAQPDDLTTSNEGDTVEAAPIEAPRPLRRELVLLQQAEARSAALEAQLAEAKVARDGAVRSQKSLEVQLQHEKDALHWMRHYRQRSEQKYFTLISAAILAVYKNHKGASIRELLKMLAESGQSQVILDMHYLRPLLLLLLNEGYH